VLGVDGPQPGPRAIDKKNRAEMRRFATALVSNGTEAKHIVDEAYMRLDLTNTSGGIDELIRLKRIVHDIVLERRRDASTEIVWEEVEMKWERDEYSVRLQPFLDRMAQPGELEGALARLPFIYRSVLVLKDVEGWGLRDIAAAQELGIPRLRERIGRARMMVVSALGSEAERDMEFRTGGRKCSALRRMFSAYLDGALPKKDSHSIERHLRRCPTCPPLYAALVAVREGRAPATTPVL
jgi:RNA polymerase sigma-70 factor, ECF subfamily